MECRDPIGIFQRLRPDMYPRFAMTGRVAAEIIYLASWKIASRRQSSAALQFRIAAGSQQASQSSAALSVGRGRNGEIFRCQGTPVAARDCGIDEGEGRVRAIAIRLSRPA